MTSITISESSGTLNPEPQENRKSQTHTSSSVSRITNRQPVHGQKSDHQVIPRGYYSGSASGTALRNLDLSTEWQIAPRVDPQNLNSLLRDDRVLSRKPSRVIDLEDEVVEIRPIDLTEGEVIDIEDLESDLEKEIFQPSIDEPSEVKGVVPQLGGRNLAIKAPLRKIDKATCRNGAYVGAGDTVELNDGRFLELTDVVENVHTGAVTLRGWELKRTSDLAGELLLRLNELCYIFEVDLDDPRPMHEQSVIEVRSGQAKKARTLTRTNYHFPAYRFDHEELPEGDQETRKRHVIAEERLVVRWQYITTFKNAKDRHMQMQYSANYQSRKFVKLHEKHCDNNHYLPSSVLRYQWREDVRLTPRRHRGNSDATKVNDPNEMNTSKSDTIRPICIDISDDEATILPKAKAPSIATNPLVSINISASDFAEADPQKFMEVIRRRFEAQMSLDLEELPAITTSPKHNTGGQKTRKSAGSDSTDKTKQQEKGKAAVGCQYSYGDGCKIPNVPRN
jgi:hypothetical protein